jgi:hypothetical protein
MGGFNSRRLKINITNNNIKTPIKRIQYLLDKNNLLHQCVRENIWYIHAVTFYTKQDLKY